ncbi:MAG: type II secretion system minor pseudopilin GspJ [Marinobacter sp.]|nr:type II secretion system minor pseudopilin GspJ [Marinobacter sp.]
MSRRRLAGQQGFTLMEVLIAVAITAIIGLGVWQVIGGVVQSRDRVDDVATEFEGLQTAFLLIERDINQIVNRPVRNLYGDFEPALSSRDEAYDLVLTHGGWRNPLGSRRSELQRSAYELIGEELHRRYWVALDRAEEGGSHDQVLLDGVTDLTIRFLNSDNKWVDDWPATDTGNGPSQTGTRDRPQSPLPRAIELTITQRRFGKLSRLFVLPDFDAQKAREDASKAAAAAAEANAGGTNNGNAANTNGTATGGGNE